MLRVAPALTLALVLGPIAVGLLWTLLPAFGVLPAIGAHEFSLKGWRDLLAFPGFLTSVRLTVTVGIGGAGGARGRGRGGAPTRAPQLRGATSAGRGRRAAAHSSH
jgi:hypothetical protein